MRLNQKHVAELERLEKLHQGRIEADHVWKAARSKSNPLHDRFEWDVNKAAIAHWRTTAREILQVWVIQSNGDQPVRAVVSLGTASPGYTSPKNIDKHALLSMFLNDLQATLRRHAYLKDMARREYDLIERAVSKLEDLGLAATTKAPKKARKTA